MSFINGPAILSLAKVIHPLNRLSSSLEDYFGIAKFLNLELRDWRLRNTNGGSLHKAYSWQIVCKHLRGHRLGLIEDGVVLHLHREAQNEGRKGQAYYCISNTFSSYIPHPVLRQILTDFMGVLADRSLRKRCYNFEQQVTQGNPRRVKMQTVSAMI
jgi:hypothetical protein